MTAIRHQINIAASPRTIWRALTTVEGLTSWWADEARLDARTGGRIVVTSEDDDGEPMEERGIIHEIRPIRRIEIAWDKNSPAPTAGTRLEFQIARDGTETRLSLVHSGTGVLDDDEQREVLSKGWRQALHALRDVLEDE